MTNTYAGGSFSSPGRLVKTIQLEQKMDYRQFISILHYRSLDQEEILAINPNLEDDIEEYREKILHSVRNRFSSKDIRPPFDQVTFTNGLFQTGIQLTKFSEQQLNDAILSHFFTLKLPLRISLRTITSEIKRTLNIFDFAPKTLEEMVSTLGKREMTISSTSRISIFAKNNSCTGLLDFSLIINDKVQSSAPITLSIDMDDAPELKKFCP